MIYSFLNYKTYLLSVKKSKPKKGRGFLSQMALRMEMTSAQMSHVMKGDRDFTLEQAIKCTQALGLTTSETEYFLEMVIFARAGNHELREFSKKKLLKLKSLGLQIKNQVPEHHELSDSQKAQFYSSWHYSAIRLLCSIKPIQIEEIVDRLHLEKSRIIEILIFLQESGLCKATNKGYVMGQQTTFVSKDSPFVHKHHSNWRLKALDQAERNLESDLFFTSPVSLSKSDFEKLKLQLADFIKQFSTTVKSSPSEQLACLNIDFFNLPY